jgi:carbamate kinase
VLNQRLPLLITKSKEVKEIFMAGAKTAVIALGGNAITQPGLPDTITNQFANTRKAIGGIVELARLGYRLVVTHGNGPQVGNALLRTELTSGKAPDLPLGILVADTEGGMGYMIQQSLANAFRQAGVDRPVVTLITEMLVDPSDPEVVDPSKYVGQFYTEMDALRLKDAFGWRVKKDADRGWRRVVPSPKPIRPVQGEVIKQLVDSGVVVIAGGGGGVPVYIDQKGNLEGLDAVIDKDYGSAVIAREIGAEILAILTGVEKVALNFGQPNQQTLGQVTVSEMKKYIDDGHFPLGSMRPKVEAAVQFIEQGGTLVTITDLDHACEAITGQAGTRIVPD